MLPTAVKNISRYTLLIIWNSSRCFRIFFCSHVFWLEPLRRSAEPLFVNTGLFACFTYKQLLSYVFVILEGIWRDRHALG